jgi:hypothetical protein
MILRLVWIPIWFNSSEHDLATQLKRSTGWVKRRLEELESELEELAAEPQQDDVAA